MTKHSLRAALRQEVKRAVTRQGSLIAKRLNRTRERLRVLRLTVRRQAVELARAQRRLDTLRTERPAVRAAAASGPRMSPKEIRRARGPRSRRVFAEMLGVSANSIFLWETGRARPRGVNLARIANARPAGKRGPGRPPGSKNKVKRGPGRPRTKATARGRRTAGARARKAA